MPKYLAMFSYSPEAMAAMIENPADREPAIRHVLESVGASLEVFYWMRGSHDGIAIIDAPDSVTMAAINATVNSTGSIRSETYDLFSTSEIHDVLDTAWTARANFTLPGRSE